MNTIQVYEKFQLRGAIKEIMRNYGIRTISLKNYFDFIGKPTTTLKNIHSVKYDIMNGYIKAYKYKENDANRRCGEPIDSITIDEYKEVYNILESLIKNEHKIPYKKKKNIMVKVNR
jgi:hypothetical protein